MTVLFQQVTGNMRRFKSLANAIRASRSGNAAVLLALGMPMLVGGTGLAVDTAQWYLWKQELQYAVDQAAIAGAWARASDEDGDSYIGRAQREYGANIDMVADYDSGPSVSLGDYDGETDNSIVVTATVTRRLPFSSYLTDEATTVAVRAEAIFDPAPDWRPCLLALDKDSDKILEFKGGPTVDAGCGVGALSDGDSSIWINGSGGSYKLGYVVTAGGFDDSHDKFDEEDNIFEGVGNLRDPFEDLTPPENDTPRSLSCPQSAGSWTADQRTTVERVYSYWVGKNANKESNLSSFSHDDPKAPDTTETLQTALTFANRPVGNMSTQNTYTEIGGGGNKKVYEKEARTTTVSYENIVEPAAETSGMMQPGTYTEFTLSCDTQLAPGVYVLDGTDIKITSNHLLTGTGVMFVLKNGAGIEISGQARLNLTGMSKAQLMAEGVSEEEAGKMEGMVIFEHPDSEGSDTASLTGGGNSVVNGIVYMPNSTLAISGNPRGVSSCLQIASGKIKLSGTTDLTTLCPPDMEPRGAISAERDMVRLVA